MAHGKGTCPACGTPTPAAADAACPACRRTTVTPSESGGPLHELPAPGAEVGGFVVERPLESGGMGHVLLAHDPGLDRKVALKFLHRRLVGDRRSEDRFLREGRALAGVDHANVVRVHGVGAWNGRPYLAMEYVEGVTLSQVARAGRASIEQALRIAEDLAAALAAIHAARIVHRDVKPANVVVRHRDGSACLLDFGLARSLSAMTDTGAGAAGTPFYMAPERIAGRRSDERADIYGFGVAMYELLTGRVPHEDAEGGAFFQAALRRDAPPLTDARPDAPRGLESLLMRALARAPELRQRDGRALLDEVRALRGRVDAGVGDDAPAGREPSAADLVPPNDPGEESPLFGRDVEYAAAARALAAVANGEGCVVLVDGAAGAGKSRLLRDVERRARALGLAVLRCDGAENAGAPFAAVRGALLLHARFAGADGPGAAAALLASTSPDDEPLVPALRKLLDPAASGADAPQDKSTLIQAALALFRAASRVRPAALFADDLHLLDEGSLDLIAALADETPTMHFAVVAAYRPATLLGRDGAFAARRARLRAGRGRTSIDLGPLSETAVAAMIRHALRVTDSEASRLAPLLHKRASGSPLYLVESLKLLEQEGHVEEGPAGRTIRQRMSALEIPPRMMELALRRIAGLPTEERDTLGVASIDAEGVSAEFVAECRDVSRLAALRVLQQLVSVRGLVREESGRYVVTHAEIREAVYGDLIPELRAAYHDGVARTLLASGEGRTRPARVGRHLRLAGRRAEAVEPLTAAGTALLAGYAPAEALDILDDAVACAGKSGCPSAEVERARAYEMLGELDRARTELVRLSNSPGEPGVAALLHLVAFERNRGHDDAAAAALARALARECSQEQRLVLHIQDAELASRAGRADDALAALARAEALADGASPGALLRLWVEEGAVRHRLDRYAQAKVWLERALDLAERLGAQEFAASCMHNLSLTCDDLDAPDEALRWAERAVERSALVGADRQQVFSSLHLSMLFLDAMRLDEADSVLARIDESVERLDSDEARYARCAREAEIALARGQFDRALPSVDRGRVLAASHPRNRANLSVLRAQILLALGGAAAAYDEARSARAELSALGADEDAEDALAVAARAMRALGQSGFERSELRAVERPLTFAAALEKSLDADNDGSRRRWREEASRLARHARFRAELAASGV